MGNSLNVVEFKRKPVTPIESKNKTATRGKKTALPRIEAVKASKGTWAFRLRWNSLPGRPVEYITRVDDATYKGITNDEVLYGQYKEQLIRIHEQGTVRPGHESNTGSRGIV